MDGFNNNASIIITGNVSEVQNNIITQHHTRPQHINMMDLEISSKITVSHIGQTSYMKISPTGVLNGPNND